MEKKSGNKFIVLEGISGSGKTELGTRLAQRISARYYTTPPALFQPLRKSIDDVACMEARFLFYLASVIQASHEISRILENQSVVCDKYIMSTICYHTVFGLNVAIPTSISYLQPDMTFLITCNEEIRIKRLRVNRGMRTGSEHDLRQPLERQCLIEFRKHTMCEIDNTADNPHLAVEKMLSIIAR